MASSVFVCLLGTAVMRGEILISVVDEWIFSVGGSKSFSQMPSEKFLAFSWIHLLICQSHTYTKMCVDTWVPCRSCEVLVFSIRYVLMCSLITKLFGEPKVYYIY